jgi:FlaG/FlaF family flagellin (archaellin)
MCRNVRISITAGLAAAFVLAVCPLAAQAKTPIGHASTSHSSGNNTNKGAKSNGTMHTAPYTKVSHDSSKSMHDYKHKDTQYSH